jgi:glutamyl-tRNA synthetase
LTQKTITRFAPSPTGLLHVGNIRTALFNYLFTIKNNGKFILRIDDTDLERSTDEFAEQIISDLKWLGIKVDKIYKQSERIDTYKKYFNQLVKDGFLYECFETQEELDYKRKRLISRRMPPVYDRASLNLSEDEKNKYLDEGRKPYWRFKLSGEKNVFDDLIRGEVVVDTSAQSDPVVVREDGGFLYNLPSVIDDVEMGITNIIRGEDHVTNSGIQIEMFSSIGKNAPIFGHHPLLVDENGDPFSKRNAALSIKGLKDKNFEPMAINSLNTSIGTSIEIKSFHSLKEISDILDLSKLGRAPGRFSLDQLTKLNSSQLSILSFEEIKDRLKNQNIIAHETLWEIIKNNIDFLSEYSKWDAIINNEVEIENFDSEFLRLAADVLPSQPWDEKTWNLWIEKIKSLSDRKGKDLFLPLRKAITGLEDGPELKELILLIGYDKIKRRLLGK